jgi:hypothetical protein
VHLGNLKASWKSSSLLNLEICIPLISYPSNSLILGIYSSQLIRKDITSISAPLYLSCITALPLAMESPKQALSLTTASSCHIQGFSDILAASHGLNPIKNDSHSCSAIPCPISLYEGSQPLVNRRSTISVHRTMGLGNHDTGIIRCKSAPGIFLAGIAFKQPVAAIPGECDSVCLQELQYSQVTDVVTGHRSDNQVGNAFSIY